MPPRKKAETQEVPAPPAEHVALCQRLAEHDVQATAIPAGLLIVNPESLGSLLDRLKEAESAAYLQTDEDAEPWEAFAGHHPSPHPVPVHKTNNPVGALQEWVMSRHAGKQEMLPVYTEEPIGDVHAPRFRISVRLPGRGDWCASADGPQKAAAKRQAAQLLLEKLAEKFGAQKT